MTSKHDIQQNVVDRIRRNIEASSDGTTTHLPRTLLYSWLGYKRFSAAAIDEIDAALRKAGIHVHPRVSKETMDRQVTFSSQPLVDPNVAKVVISPDRCPVRLYDFQAKAVQELRDRAKGEGFSGLLVLPTGAGKTLTAAWWLLGDVIDRGGKVLWIAHRHELLNQAAASFERVAYASVAKQRDAFRYRIVSGMHDRPVNIRQDDDLIIASKDSLRVGLHHLDGWITPDVTIVIDEAHHAPARSYRRLIDYVRAKAPGTRLLGLTATPIRTGEKEQGAIGALFSAGIVNNKDVDLSSLVARGFLSKPVFEEHRTEVQLDLTARQLESVRRMDISGLGEATIRSLAQNSQRNHKVVATYASDRTRYGQTLVYAINVDNAIALDALFRDQGIASRVVVSSLRDGSGASVSAEKNAEAIKAFRDREVDVLINVNILTEGVDVPAVQSVFLARPTISTILMTQMIGRGLRGTDAGGTKETFIVSFIDDWKDKIAWVNPERLHIEENLSLVPEREATRVVELVAIAKIEELARVLDETEDTHDLDALAFLSRVPVGFYFVRYLTEIDGGEEDEVNREILVYDNAMEHYERFLEALPQFVESYGLAEAESVDDANAEFLARKVEEQFFYDVDQLLAYRRADLGEIIRHFLQARERPAFIELTRRNELDIDRVARHVLDGRLSELEKRDYLTEIWTSEATLWRAFFRHNQRSFLHEVNLSIERVLYPELFKTTPPEVVNDPLVLERLSLCELRRVNPARWRDLTESVHRAARRTDGSYVCAVSGFSSKDLHRFEIDHIVPMSEGGRSVPENLRLLERKVNRVLGAALVKQDAAKDR